MHPYSMGTGSTFVSNMNPTPISQSTNHQVPEINLITKRTVGKSGRRRRSVQSSYHSGLPTAPASQSQPRNDTEDERRRQKKEKKIRKEQKRVLKAQKMAKKEDRRSPSSTMLHVDHRHQKGEIYKVHRSHVTVPNANTRRSLSAVDQTRVPKPVYIATAPANPLMRSPFEPMTMAERERVYRPPVLFSSPPKLPQTSSSLSSATSDSIRVSASSPLPSRSKKTNQKTLHTSPVVHDVYKSTPMRHSGGYRSQRAHSSPPHLPAFSPAKPNYVKKPKNISISEDVGVIRRSSSKEVAQKSRCRCCGTKKDHSMESSSSVVKLNTEEVQRTKLRKSPAKNRAKVHTVEVSSSSSDPRSISSSSTQTYEPKKTHKKRRFHCGGFCGFCKEDPSRMSDYPDSKKSRFRCTGRCCGFHPSEASPSVSLSSSFEQFVPPKGSAVEASMTVSTPVRHRHQKSNATIHQAQRIPIGSSPYTTVTVSSPQRDHRSISGVPRSPLYQSSSPGHVDFSGRPFLPSSPTQGERSESSPSPLR